MFVFTARNRDSSESSMELQMEPSARGTRVKREEGAGFQETGRIGQRSGRSGQGGRFDRLNAGADGRLLREKRDKQVKQRTVDRERGDILD